MSRNTLFRVLSLVMLVAAAPPAANAAQEPSNTLATTVSTGELEEGDTVLLTEARPDGSSFERKEARFLRYASGNLFVLVDEQTVEVPEARILRVKKKYNDPLTNSLLIGAGIIGAGYVLGAIDDAGCTGLCFGPGFTLVLTVPVALLAVISDLVHRGEKTVFVAMFGLFAAFGWLLLGGLGGVLWLGSIGLLSAALGARASPHLLLRAYRAEPIAPARAPGLFRILETLAERAGLPGAPRPYYVPSNMINAFAVGSRSNSAIGITDGLLRGLQPREMQAVLAHEIAHVANNDAWVLGLADVFTRMVNVLSRVGQLMLLIQLPAILLGRRPPFSFELLLLMILAPAMSALLQLALSRTREFDADLGGARLTGDPRGLATALHRMDQMQGGLFEHLLRPGRNVPDPSLLRTHPPTAERVRRLLAIEQELKPLAPPVAQIAQLRSRPQERPRWRWWGNWY